MNTFERTINHWRTMTEDNILIDGKDSMARATISVKNATVTVYSNVPFAGDPFYITPDDLKIIRRVDDLRLIHDRQFVGKPTVEITERRKGILQPVQKTIGTFTVDRSKLEYVLLAASNDPSREILNSIFFTATHMVATDGYRLHVKKGTYAKKDVLLDSKILKHIKSDFVMKHDNGASYLYYQDKDNEIMVKIPWLQYKYVDYKAPMPRNIQTEFILPYDECLKKIKQDFLSIITVDSKIVIESYSNENKDTCTKFELPSNYKGASIRFGIRPQYLYEAMDGADATIGFNEPDLPIMVNNSLVMPMYI